MNEAMDTYESGKAEFEKWYVNTFLSLGTNIDKDIVRLIYYEAYMVGLKVGTDLALKLTKRDLGE